MADVEESTAAAPRAPPPPPVSVAYCPITGIPPEYNEYLPKDSEEFKRWKAASQPVSGDAATSAVSAGMEGLSVEAKEGDAPAKPADGGEEKVKSSKKKKNTRAVTIESSKRQKNKTTTVVTGLDLFDIKLAEVRRWPLCYLSP